MTDKEIVKALECCKTGDDCKGCPYCVNGRYTCSEHFNEDVLDLINRQKAEIEKCENIIRLADKTIEKQSAEIKRLEQENFDRSLTVETWKWEAVKEFAELLKEHIGDYHPYYYVIDEEVVDNLVKEMVGENNG